MKKILLLPVLFALSLHAADPAAIDPAVKAAVDKINASCCLWTTTSTCRRKARSR